MVGEEIRVTGYEWSEQLLAVLAAQPDTVSVTPYYRRCLRVGEDRDSDTVAIWFRAPNGQVGKMVVDGKTAKMIPAKVPFTIRYIRD